MVQPGGWLKNTLERMMRAAKRGQRLISEGPHRECPDSDEIAVFLAGALIAAGQQVRFRVVTQDLNTPYHHVFVEVFFKGVWLKLDTECNATYVKSETYPSEDGENDPQTRG